MRYSHSRVDLYERCPYHFKIRYIDRLQEMPDLDNPKNPLILGSALHMGIEKESTQEAIDYYFNSYPGLNNKMIEEVMKLKYVIPKTVDFLKDKFKGLKVQHEYQILTDDFNGFVDLIVYHDDGTISIVDFKYSNAIENYRESGQLSLYKYYLEKQGFKVRDLYYLFIPKINTKQNRKESIQQHRNRMMKELELEELSFVKIEYRDTHIENFFKSIGRIENHTSEWEKNPTKQCFTCNMKEPEYLNAIQKGEVLMALPVNTRREKKVDKRPDFWIFADSYVGKSTFVDNVDNVLFINTDGNTDNTTAPIVEVADIPKKQGRRTVIEYGWEDFVETITDLATEENSFEAVAIDLVEDLYELCRSYVFDKNSWEHESDGDWGKGWAMVKKEFNDSIKRLKMLGYQVIYISKEKTSTVKLSGGQDTDHFSPNIGNGHANFLSGTVDMTLRAYIDTDDIHKLQLLKDKNSFGGTRIGFKTDVINLEYDEFVDELVRAQDGLEVYKDEKVEIEEDEPEKVKEEKPKKERKRKRKTVDEVEADELPTPEEIDEMGVKELKVLLDDEDIEYTSRPKKPELLELAYILIGEHELVDDSKEQAEEPEEETEDEEQEDPELEDAQAEEAEEEQEEEKPRRRRRRRN